MPTITGIDHLAITVSDLESSVRFYSVLWAMEPVATLSDGPFLRRIFALPGFGKLTLDAVFTRDYPVIQAVVLIITVSYILINLAVDILYSVVNPKIRVGGAN